MAFTDPDEDEPDGFFLVERYGDEYTIVTSDIADEDLSALVSKWLERGAYGPIQ